MIIKFFLLNAQGGTTFINIWNILIIFLFTIFIFYALGRVIQKRFKINVTNFKISIPIGFILFLSFNFVFLIPTIFLNDLGFTTYKMLNYIKIVVILIFILSFYNEWFPNLNKLKLNFNFKIVYSIGLFIIFIISIILFNYFFESFNKVENDFIPNSEFYLSGPFTSLNFNNYTFHFLTSISEKGKVYISDPIYYYEWLLLIISTTIIYFTSQSLIFNKVENYYYNLSLGFVLSLLLTSVLWFTSSNLVIFYEFIIFLISFTLIEYFYKSWEKNINIIIFIYISIAIISTMSRDGVYFFIAYFISINIYHFLIKKDHQKSLIFGSYFLFFILFIYLYEINFIYDVVFSFAYLIILIPYTVSFYGSKSESKSDSENIGFFEFEKGYSFLIFFSLINIVALVTLIVVSDYNQGEIKIYLSEYYSLFKSLSTFNNFLIYLFLFDLPMVLYFVFGYLLNPKPKQYSIYSIMYIIFLNPLAFFIANEIFNINLEAFLLFYPIVLLYFISFFSKLIWKNIFERYKQKKQTRRELNLQNDNPTS